jgi:uncharacterized protein YbjT (DUF2867 family)
MRLTRLIVSAYMNSATGHGVNNMKTYDATVDTDRKLALLTEALQLFTQAIGGPRGYIPTLGEPKTKRALELMKEAGVKPVYHR